MTKESAEQMPEPEFWEERKALWEKFKQRRQEEIEDKKGKSIKVTLPDGTEKEGESFITTPFDIAKSISNGLANNAIVAKVDGKLWDVGRPLEQDCKVEIISDWNDPEAKHVFWHSSAHVLGQALERKYHMKLCTGPPLKEGQGFFYEGATDSKVSENDFNDIDKIVNQITKEKQPFERLELTKDEALELFKYNPYKSEILKNKVPEGVRCTAYRCGNLIDPCKGPHLLHTGRVKAFTVTKNSSAYWQGDSSKDSLQRVYAVSFPDKKLMKKYKEFIKQAAERDHRLIGRKQELWFFHEHSPGCTFFLPRGARLYNTLIQLLQKQYWKRGYEEVMTPNIFNVNLWKTSGHWQNYSENMFSFKCENVDYAMKPMNCPSHCLMFKNQARSYKELPIRYADFGVLHRNELSGTLSGMTRVRRFCQDDAHIFCTKDQIKSEINGVINFMKFIYGIFGFEFKLCLSTRPEEKFIGEIEVWNQAEKALEEVLRESGLPWEMNPGDGAFYGPKIDVVISDAMERQHQCATVQLDFNLPERFDLLYTTADTEGERQARPVIIHRAIYGSFERFLAIVTEHFGGKWPFWLSPRQVVVIPVSDDKHAEYAKKVRDTLRGEEIICDVDLSGRKLNKKIREAQVAQYNFILVVGQDEQENNSVNVRTRDTSDTKVMSLDDALEHFQDLRRNYK
eukprot:gb/GECH01012535.1/.p1 GENE.gb/GECH01012535.1/~~gb/GECH01012535.1/.p1  ORF type:complete len:681 (+),score=214.99 gb/GECH01012535.1/:1-2043(+)